MKKRDISILVGLGMVVLLVAWYFLIIGPKRDDISKADAELKTEKTKYDEDSARVKRIDDERSASKQTSGELLKLNKLVPVDSQVPSMIVELQQSANEAGIDFMKIEPGEAVAGTEGNAVIPMELQFMGKFFDVNDFLYRVENYARMEGNDVNVSGRLISVVGITMEEPELEEFPSVMATLQINAYMTSPAPASKKSSKSNTSTTKTTE